MSTCVLRVVLNSDDFSECVTMLDPGLFMYFQIEATDIREYHRWAIIEYMQEFRKVQQKRGDEVAEKQIEREILIAV